MPNVTLGREEEPLEDGVHLNAGFMSAMLVQLVLSGSRLSKNRREEEIVVWLAEHDETVWGRGCNDFGIRQMPWTKAGHEEEKKFVIKMVEGAKNRLGWETLGEEFKPTEEVVKIYEENLDKLAKLVGKMTVKEVNEEGYRQWVEDKEMSPGVFADGFKKCPKHGVWLYWHGCIACNW